MMTTICIAVPAFNRPAELGELLLSVTQQNVFPNEVVVAEDCSPLREQIKMVCDQYTPILAAIGVKLVYSENERNLGYDGNLRRCFELSSSDWTMLMGNDDLLLPEAVEIATKFIEENNVDFISRAFVRFEGDINRKLGVSSISPVDEIFHVSKSSSRMIFRSAGFVGGLLVKTSFAKNISTSNFDGSLYYQIYLAAIAFCQQGIGYISTPLIGGRAGNPPMFGTSQSDSDVHVPGSYTAKGRAKMWRGVLNIVTFVENKFSVQLKKDMVNELMVRQAFHIFEMNVVARRSELRNLKAELTSLGLFSHWFPRSLYVLNYIAGRQAMPVYKLARRIMQN